MKDMSPRERVVTALSGRQPDRVPKYAGFSDPMLEMFKKKTGSNSPKDYFKMEMRYVLFEPELCPDQGGREAEVRAWYGAAANPGKFLKYFSHFPKGAIITEWGVGFQPGSTSYYSKVISPMGNFHSPEEIDEYPFPDVLAQYRHQYLEKEVSKLHSKGYAAVGGGEMPIFELARDLRGFENLIVDMMLNQKMARVLLDKITNITCSMARRYAESGADILSLGDDVGIQKKMLMSPETWRKWLKPRLSKVIGVARKVNPGMLVYYHSDGYIEPIIPDLIEAGVDILNPVQPECMNPVEVKERYGDRLAFFGTVGIQTTMPHGTPEDVKKEVKMRIETVGKGGGLLIAPTHVIEPDVPWENILAFFDAVEEYGKY